MPHVITGKNRGMKLLSPGKSDRTRPTEDKIKEAVFNILQPLKVDADVLDLFAGTGQIGIEFLSRGAGHVVFGEKSRSMAKILRENIRKTGQEEQSVVFVRDYREVIAGWTGAFDYVYLDPPFGYDMEKEAMAMLRRLHRVKPNGLVILESAAPAKGEEEPSDIYCGFVSVFDRTYGRKRIRVFKEES